MKFEVAQHTLPFAFLEKFLLRFGVISGLNIREVPKPWPSFNIYSTWYNMIIGENKEQVLYVIRPLRHDLKSPQRLEIKARSINIQIKNVGMDNTRVSDTFRALHAVLTLAEKFFS